MYTFEIEKSGALSEESRREKCFRWGKDGEKRGKREISPVFPGKGGLRTAFPEKGSRGKNAQISVRENPAVHRGAFLFSCRFRLEFFPDVVE